MTAVVAKNSWVGIRRGIEDEWIALSDRVRNITIDQTFEPNGLTEVRIALDLLTLDVKTPPDDLIRERNFWIKIKEHAGPVSMDNAGWECLVVLTKLKQNMNHGQLMTTELELKGITDLEESRTESPLRDAIKRAVNSRKRQRK